MFDALHIPVSPPTQLSVTFGENASFIKINTNIFGVNDHGSILYRHFPFHTFSVNEWCHLNTHDCNLCSRIGY